MREGQPSTGIFYADFKEIANIHRKVNFGERGFHQSNCFLELEAQMTASVFPD